MLITDNIEVGNGQNWVKVTQVMANLTTKTVVFVLTSEHCRGPVFPLIATKLAQMFSMDNILETCSKIDILWSRAPELMPILEPKKWFSTLSAL